MLFRECSCQADAWHLPMPTLCNALHGAKKGPQARDCKSNLLLALSSSCLKLCGMPLEHVDADSMLLMVQGKLCKPATVVSLLVALALTGVMYKRFLSTGKMMPAGIVALLSAAMSIFYVWNLLAVKPPSAHHSS